MVHGFLSSWQQEYYCRSSDSSPQGGIHVALPLAAFSAAAALFAVSRSKPAWRWAAWGSLLWGCEEALWASVRLGFIPETTLLTGLFYYAGTLLWVVTLLKLPGRAPPRISLVAALPVLLYVLWLLTRNVGFSLVLQFPIVDLALACAALPLLEKSFRGEATEGRLLWWLGLFVRALAGALYTWLAPDLVDKVPFYLLWVFGYTFIMLGGWSEARGDERLWPITYTLLSLEAITAIILVMLAATERTLGMMMY